MLQIAVVGAGSHSTSLHGVAMAQLKDRDADRFEIAAVCDLDLAKARAYQQRFGARRAYADLDAMLAVERPDALMAVTPIGATESIVSKLLPKGIPLLIEKPPGADAAAAERLGKLAAECGTPHMVSFNRRFVPSLTRALEWIGGQGGRRPLTVHGRMLRHRRREADFVMGTAIHLIDAICSILGAPTRVEAASTPTGTDGVSFVTGAMDFGGGRRATFQIAPDAGVLAETYEILGPDYAIGVDALAGGLTIHHAGAGPSVWTPDAEASRVELDGTVAETDAFLRAVAGEGPWAPTLADAVVSMRAAEAVAAGGVTELRP